MSGSIFEVVLYALGGCIVGAVIGWSVQAASSRRHIAQLNGEIRAALDDFARQRDEFATQKSRSRSAIKSLKMAYARRSAKLESVLEKSKLLAKNVRTLRAEREHTKIKVCTIQDALASLRQKSAALQTEFEKSREFYKRELVKSFEMRKALEEDIKKARAEQEAFAKQVESSILEHGSEENMVVAAQLRLGQLDVLERNVNKLEAENAQLRNDANQLKQEFEARERDLKDLEELRLHNKQLVRHVEALEDSRREYEADAEQYREQADQSEKESDTLRLKLEDLERNFADIEKQQHSALEDARNATVVPMLRKQR